MVTLVGAELVGFLLGLLLGSFLNVCITRIPRGESVVRPGSRCMGCGHEIRWFDNLPVVSWLALRGRCRDCRDRISWRYPVVELAAGVWFLISAAELWRSFAGARTGMLAIHFSGGFDNSLEALGFASLGFLLIGLIAMDWQTLRLPDAFTLSGIAMAVFLVCTQAIFLGPREDQITFTSKHLRLSSPGSFAAKGNVFLTGPEALIFGRMAAIVGAALVLLLVRWAYKALRGREGLGLGDVKMLAMVAAFLGFWPAMLTLFTGVMLASGYGLMLMARGRAGALTRLPLGSFLGLGGLFTALFGGAVLEWYGGLLR